MSFDVWRVRITSNQPAILYKNKKRCRTVQVFHWRMVFFLSGVETMAQKVFPWTNTEVQAFLSLVADERIQSELDDRVRNVRVFMDLSQQMLSHGYHRSAKQCWEKLKKLKCDYRKIGNGRSGGVRTSWRWYNQVDAIYGHRPANNGSESGGIDSAKMEPDQLAEDGESCFL